VLGVLIRQQHDYMRAIWFNQPYMRDKFSRGQRVLISGKARLNGGRWEMAHPRVEAQDPDDEPPQPTILPVYPLTDGLQR
jgi:ATP-dependent DNA helicase RecG